MPQAMMMRRNKSLKTGPDAEIGINPAFHLSTWLHIFMSFNNFMYHIKIFTENGKIYRR
jgi:hypothetical protein